MNSPVLLRCVFAFVPLALCGCNGSSGPGGGGGGTGGTGGAGGTGGVVGGGGTGAPRTQGAALAIGLNRVDPAHYGGWSGPLTGCEPDARDMDRIARDQGLSSKMLLTAAATRQAVLDEIASAAGRLAANDLYVLSYSGHGGQIPDFNGDDPEDGLDETWCLFDGELLDDEIYTALGAFQPGVRVLVFSDSCHSGTVLRTNRRDFEAPTRERVDALNRDMQVKSRSRAIKVKDKPAPVTASLRIMPPDAILTTYTNNKAFYERVGSGVSGDARAGVRCHAILISGCEDPQLSADLGTNGLFTLAVKNVWNSGAFSGGHADFHQAIKAAVLQSNPDQAPDFFTVGVAVAGYEAQRPYTLTAP